MEQKKLISLDIETLKTLFKDKKDLHTFLQ